MTIDNIYREDIVCQFCGSGYVWTWSEEAILCGDCQEYECDECGTLTSASMLTLGRYKNYGNVLVCNSCSGN